MKLHTFISIAAVLVFAGAQAQQTPLPPQSAEPSTSPTEGTAADRTAPGETPTQDEPRQPLDPTPATSPGEGTAADRSVPGSTRNQGNAGERSEIVGAAVVSSADAPLGEVVDVVFDAANRPEFVVIQSEGKAMAMPYSAATSMKKADKIVVDESRLQAAPKVEEGAWRNPASNRWKQEAARYWGRG